MSRHRLWLLAALVAGLALTTAHAQDDDKKAFDEAVFKSLKDVINRGADLYNSQDQAGCYRVYEGALRTVSPLLPHKPDLQKAIAKSIASAEADPVVWRRAFTLRSALDKVRDELNPKKEKKDKEKLPDPKKDPVGEKKPDEKKDPIDEKKPEEKKPEDKKPEEKKSEDKKPLEKLDKPKEKEKEKEDD